MKRVELTVFIGCFNEKDTILQSIDEAKKLPVDKEIIVIDNASTDGTQELLKGLDDDSLRIVIKQRNYGTGHSYKMGIAMARGEYLYAPGADLEYRMSDVLEMIKKQKENNVDVVFGSRLRGKKILKWALLKERPFWLGTFIATFLVNKLYGRNFTDVIAPKLAKISLLRGLKLKAGGHAVEFELVSRLCKKGIGIEEIPVFYNPRTHKQGKTIRAIDMIPAILTILKVKFLG